MLFTCFTARDLQALLALSHYSAWLYRVIKPKKTFSFFIYNCHGFVDLPYIQMNACWPMVAARITATIPREAITARVTMALSYTIHSNVEVKYKEYIVVYGIKYGIS